MPDQQVLLFKFLDDAVDKYQAQAKRLKRINYGFRIFTLLLAAASTVLLGLNIPDNPAYLVWSRNVALVLGAISTFVIGLSAYWNLETYWLKSKGLFERVRALREKCQFLQANSGTLSLEEIDEAFIQYRSIMDDQIEYWEKKAAEQTRYQTKASHSPQKTNETA